MDLVRSFFKISNFWPQFKRTPKPSFQFFGILLFSLIYRGSIECINLKLQFNGSKPAVLSWKISYPKCSPFLQVVDVVQKPTGWEERWRSSKSLKFDCLLFRTSQPNECSRLSLASGVGPNLGCAQRWSHAIKVCNPKTQWDGVQDLSSWCP